MHYLTPARYEPVNRYLARNLCTVSRNGGVEYTGSRRSGGQEVSVLGVEWWMEKERAKVDMLASRARARRAEYKK